MPIAITAGEPAGIGPELVVQLAQRQLPHPIVAVGDPNLFLARALALKLELRIVSQVGKTHIPGTLPVVPILLDAPVSAGQLDVKQVNYVLNTLQQATLGCLEGRYSALVTGPVHKGIINQAGHPFTGQTEFVAKLCQIPTPVMLLANRQLKVALVTTHLPLAAVPQQITPERLTHVLTILRQDLISRFRINEPRIAVCGLNPHAGENGYLGSEEITTIIPTLEYLRQQGFHLLGPLPADTAFLPAQLKQCDVVLAMYHDQGLPVLKAQGFGESVNITLGLPIIRTSVDHGTALALAGTGLADVSSFYTALEFAIELSQPMREPA